jgi:hypothetical protein
MDENKLIKLKEIKYRIYKCCALCKFGRFLNDWGTCDEHTYEHKKHSTSKRQLSIHKSGYCDDFELGYELGKWKVFLVE